MYFVDTSHCLRMFQRRFTPCCCAKHCVLFYTFLGAPGSKCVSNTRPSAYWGEIVHKITGRHLISLLTLKKGSSCYILWPTWKANFRVSAAFLFFTMTLNRNCMNLKIVHFRMISGETSFQLCDNFCCVLIHLRSLDFYSFPSRIISKGWICFSFLKIEITSISRCRNRMDIFWSRKEKNTFYRTER